ncbi:C-type lectin domain family 2 member B-like [Hyperolius riggenbachi]|uniref:C-type lectin domain family 2 member B-like n=1 Tax=Hyperolius riggenbachi TaxID=752182 RepID=UPI0035A3143F
MSLNLRYRTQYLFRLTLWYSNIADDEEERRRKNLTFFIVSFAVTNVILLTAMWMAVSVRGRKDCFCPEVAPPPPCEDGWIWYKNKCYYFSETFQDWHKSRTFCFSHNASLALIDSEEELAFLKELEITSYHWIGLKKEDQWKWANGSLFNSMFTIHGASSCVFLSHKRVTSAPCYADRYWICNKPDTLKMWQKYDVC